MSISSVFIREFPEEALPTLNREQLIEKEKENEIVFEDILASLAIKVSKVHRPKIYSPSEDSSLLGSKLKKIFCNLPQVISDFFTYRSSKAADPELPTFVPKRFYKMLSQARIFEHQNLMGLFCCGPATATASVVCTSLPPAALCCLSETNNICGYINTGCRTHYWDHTKILDEVRGHLTSGYSAVAEYLKKKWFLMRDITVITQCESIANNYLFMLESMKNFGYSKDQAKSIFEPLRKVIIEIKMHSEPDEKIEKERESK